MDIPPPPPLEEAGEVKAPAKELAVEEDVLPELPPLDSGEHFESEMPEIKPKMLEKAMPKMPEFPSHEEMPGMEEPEEEPIEEAAPVKEPQFLKASESRSLVAEAEEMRRSLNRIGGIIKEIDSLKEAEEKEFHRWRINLEDAEKKLSYVDRVIFKEE
jgi:hypothetical protein